MNADAHPPAWQTLDFHYLRTLDLQQRLFTFGHLDRPPYHRYFRFLPNGRIGGHHNPNEARWELRGDHAVMLNIDGMVTTRIDRLEQNHAGKLRMYGPMITAPTGAVTHCWEEIDEPYSIATDPSAFTLDTRIPAKPRRNLVIIGADEQSLHHQWPHDIPDAERTWDLCISFYGKPEHYPPPGPAEYTSLQPGLRKWRAIHRAMHKNSPLWHYERILILDDDIRTTWADINRFLEIARDLDMVLAQPALKPGCHITHPITEQQPNCLVRFTTFVEAMAPCFTAEALRLCIPTTQGGYYGFGIDHLWPRILGMPKNRIGVIDAIAIDHTRPIGTNYHLAEAVREEADLYKLYGVGGGLGYFETGRIMKSYHDRSNRPAAPPETHHPKRESHSEIPSPADLPFAHI